MLGKQCYDRYLINLSFSEYTPSLRESESQDSPFRTVSLQMPHIAGGCSNLHLLLTVNGKQVLGGGKRALQHRFHWRTEGRVDPLLKTPGMWTLVTKENGVHRGDMLLSNQGP
jgi:hypothetical protein